MEHELHPALAETGRFKVKHCLGSGGFGVVYAAYDTQSDAHVALKWLRNSDASTIARFKREFRSLADLVHPNLVGFRELLTVAGEWFFTMDLVSGVDLLRWVRPASPADDAETSSNLSKATTGADALGGSIALLPPPSSASRAETEPLDTKHRPLCIADLPRLRGALEQLAIGLVALHDAGWLHRDVKPSNVLVTRDGRVVLLDFGLVTELGEGRVAQTMTGHIVGTPAYMSPEQALGSAITPASDWYAVGVILFQALTGRLPFDGEPQSLLVRKQLGDPPAPHTLVRGVPRALSELCVDLLSRTPERRPTGRRILERLRDLPGGSLTSELINPNRAPQSPFVGRETHLWALDEALDEAERGKTVIALVPGPSGMGKTALVRQFLDVVRHERPETVILEGRCYERESMPYKALDSLVDSLCRYLQRLPEVEAAKLLPRDVAALARVFPVFLQFEGAAGRRPRARADAVQERRRAFDALRELLARVADRNPLVLFIDDLQWGDGDSEPLLLTLFRPPDPPPLLLIGSYRIEDAPTSPLVRALRKLSGTGEPLEVCEIPVGELSPEAARELAISILGPDAYEHAAEIASESFGSPLFLRQLAAIGARSGRTDLASAIAARVEGLEPEARRLLETLAVSGRPLALATAARAAGIEHDAQGVLAKLRAETLVRTRGVEARDEIEIYHDRIREAVVANLPASELEGRHRRLARVLSASNEGDPEVLAMHFRAAGERELAAEYAEQAAERAASALAFTRAAHMYEMALELGSTLGRDAATTRLKLAEALVSAGRGTDAAHHFLEAARAASASDALELRRRAAEQLLFSGRIEDGIRVVEEILRVMKMRAPATRIGAVASLLWRRLVLWLRGTRFRERSVDELSRERLVKIDTCYSMSLGLGMVDPIRGADFQTRYLLLALAAGEPVRIARGLALEAAYRASDGHRSRGAIDRLLATARDLAERIGQPHAQALIALMSGVSRVILGDFAEAIPLCDRASAELREKCTGVAWELDNAAFFAAFSLLHCGRIRELAERLPALLDDTRQRGDLYGEVLLRLQGSWFINLANDDVAKARADLLVITDEWSRERFLLQHAWRLVNGIEVALYAGEPHVAEDLIAEAWPRLERSLFMRSESMRSRVTNAVARASLAAAATTTDREAREARLAQATRHASALATERWPMAKGLALLLRGGVAAIREERGVAIGLFEGAATELDRNDSTLYATAARLNIGVLRGGDEGKDLVRRAEERLAQERIVRPRKIARIFSPALLAVDDDAPPVGSLGDGR